MNETLQEILTVLKAYNQAIEVVVKEGEKVKELIEEQIHEDRN